MKQWLVIVGGPCVALVAGFLLSSTRITERTIAINSNVTWFRWIWNEQQHHGSAGSASSVGAGAGWLLDHDIALDLQKERCTIQRIVESEMTTDRFMQEFWRQKPVIIQRLQGTNRVAQTWTTKTHMLHTFAEKQVPLAALEAYSFRGERKGNFGTYLKSLNAVDANTKGNETPFAFGVDQYGVGELYVVPAVLTNSKLEWHFQVAVAASGAGLPFHWHADVFAEVLHGERRWFVYPPQKSPIFNPRAASAQWLKEVYPTTHTNDEDALLECTLFPDESIYVPADWFHSTLSLGEAVSITTSFAAQYRRERYELSKGPSDHAHMLDALERRDLVKALHHAEQLRLYRPHNFVPYSWLGVIQTLQARTLSTDQQVRMALETARRSTQKCIELNPLYAPCHVWLNRQLMALSMFVMETNKAEAAQYERLAFKAKKEASELSFAEDDEILDPRWQPRNVKRSKSN